MASSSSSSLDAHTGHGCTHGPMRCTPWVTCVGAVGIFFFFFWGAHTDGLVYQAPTEWVICVGAFCTDSLVYQAPTEWVICAGSEGIFFFFSGGNGYCLGFGVFVCVFGDRVFVWFCLGIGFVVWGLCCGLGPSGFLGFGT